MGLIKFLCEDGSTWNNYSEACVRDYEIDVEQIFTAMGIDLGPNDIKTIVSKMDFLIEARKSYLERRMS